MTAPSTSAPRDLSTVRRQASGQCAEATTSGPLAAVGPAVRYCLAWDRSPAAPLRADADAWIHEVEHITAGGLSSLALRALRVSAGEPDGELMARLRATAFDDISRTAQRAALVGDVLGELSASGLSFVVIKGPAVARFYDVPDERRYADIDILVDRGDFTRARRIAVRAGYDVPHQSQQPWAAFDTICREGINLHGPAGANLDLHHRIPPWTFGAALTFAAFWSGSEPGRVGEVEVRVAGPSESLVVSGLHLISDLWKGSPGLATWRDLLVLAAHVGPTQATAAFAGAGLSWYVPLLRQALGSLVEDPSDVLAPIPGAGASSRPGVARGRGEAVRLRRLGWAGEAEASGHRGAWALRLPALRGLVFVAGSAVPSPRYVAERHGSYPRYWRQVMARPSRSDFSPTVKVDS